MPKHGVLLLQMGGPCCTQEVESFLFNLFKDPYIIQLPWFIKAFQKNLARLISSKRAPKVAENYQEIGGGSPILFETQCQARALKKLLNNSNSKTTEFKTFIAMRYSYPYLKDTIKDILASNLDELSVIPLYPQYSIATTGSSFAECQEFFAEHLAKQIKINYIKSWEINPYFIELLCNRIQDSLKNFAEDQKIKVLFSAHGLPEKYIRDGDPYQEQVLATVDAVINMLVDDFGFVRIENSQIQKNKLTLETQVTYQSRVGPVKWLEPNTEDVIIDLGKQGYKNILVVPVSFVGDHIETLHELGIEYRELAKEHGVSNYFITRLPKANHLLIKALASQVKSKSIAEETSKYQNLEGEEKFRATYKDPLALGP